MGGRALKEIETIRYSKEEYYAILPEIELLSKKIFKDVYITKCYRQKDSFGDIDVLCLTDDLQQDINIELFNIFKPNQVYKNTNCWSFDYKKIQIDFILTEPENWETSKIYYSYNDVGNLIGKIAHCFGLKYGHEGLKWVGFVPQKKEIILTKDNNVALEFLGFDYNKFNNGFETLDEIFEFVISSKYFNPKFYDLSLQNKTNRDRDKKRINYQLFLGRIEKLNSENFYHIHKNRDYYLGLIDHYFPGFMKKYSELYTQKEMNQKVREIFNGNVIKHLYGKNVEKISHDIAKFRNSFSSIDEMNRYILETADTEKVLEKYKSVVGI